LVTTTLKEFDQFALRTGVELLLPWFHLRRPPSRTSWQDYRRCRLHILRHGCLLSQLPAPEQKSTRVAQKITPLSQQFSSPHPAQWILEYQSVTRLRRGDNIMREVSPAPPCREDI